MWSDHDALFLSGGGLKCASFLGALALYDLTALREVYGVSAGSLIACMLAVGYNLEMVRLKFLQTPWPSVFAESCSLVRLFAGQGMMDGSQLRTLMEGWLSEKNVPPRATLGWLARHRPAVRFGCVVVDVDAGELVLLSAPKWAQVTLTDAVLASMALPGLLDPVLMAGRRFMDAGIVNNAPLSMLPARRPGRRLLALVLHTHFPSEELMLSSGALLWLKCNFISRAEVLSADPACTTVLEMSKAPAHAGLLRCSAEALVELQRQGYVVGLARSLARELAGFCVMIALAAHASDAPAPLPARTSRRHGIASGGGAEPGGAGGDCHRSQHELTGCRDARQASLLDGLRRLGKLGRAALDSFIALVR